MMIQPSSCSKPGVIITGGAEKNKQPLFNQIGTTRISSERVQEQHNTINNLFYQFSYCQGMCSELMILSDLLTLR